MKDTKIYVPVLTLTSRANQRFSKPLSKGCEISVCWDE